ncbi:class I SAM-dependent methyltransferase [Patescibacteria group bacterium]|nr:class I SAM-dependent methyltransferase [Patescibacteria group bacterium]MBU1473178.1 class I SAM-dependent methyltransferase [Patescibacteria group bacterium]
MVIGQNYWRHSDLLLEQLKQMSSYSKKMKYPRWSRPFVALYIRFFGIPEVGIQLRAYYFFKFLSSLPKSFTPKRLMDAGCGIGLYYQGIRNMYPNIGIEGIDLNNAKISFCKKFWPGDSCQFFHKNFSTYSSPKKYDLVLSIDVLEHVKNYQKYLDNAGKLCSKKGYLYINTHLIPKHWYLDSSANWKHKEHAREGFIFKDLIRAVEKAGFTIVRSKKSFGFFGSLSFEVYLLFLEKNIIISALFFPILHLISNLDYFFINPRGHTVSILAIKK